MHLVEVGGEDIPQLPQPLPVLGGLQLLLLVGDFSCGAVPGGGHRPDEVLAPLLDALQVLPLLVEAVQQLGEGRKVLQLQAALILSGGKEGKVKGLALFSHHCCCHVMFLHIIQQFLQAVQQLFPACRSQGIQAHIGAAPCPPGQLPAHQRGQPSEGVQQPLIRLGLLRSLSQQLLQGRPVLGSGVQLVLGRGQAVEHARQQSALISIAGPQVGVHPSETVQNAAVPVQQQQIGPAADGLQHQLALYPVPQLVEGLQGEGNHPLQMGLLHRQHSASRQVLAQQHTEHGGRVWVLPGQPGELRPGMGGIGGKKQAHIPLGGTGAGPAPPASRPG